MALNYSLGGTGQGPSRPKQKTIKVTKTEKEELDDTGSSGTQKRTDAVRSIVGIEGRKSYPAGSALHSKESASVDKKIDRSNSETESSPVGRNRISEEAREKIRLADKVDMEKAEETKKKYPKPSLWIDKMNKTSSILKKATDMKNVDGSKGDHPISPINNKPVKTLFPKKEGL